MSKKIMEFVCVFMLSVLCGIVDSYIFDINLYFSITTDAILGCGIWYVFYLKNHRGDGMDD